MRYYDKKWRDMILRGEPLPAWMQRHPRKDYVIAVNLSMVDWADRAKIFKMRMCAKFMTMLTGRRYVLDHVIPITHTHVCGLTVHTNLRVVPYAVNAAKGNKWNPDQMELDIDDA